MGEWPNFPLPHLSASGYIAARSATSQVTLRAASPPLAERFGRGCMYSPGPLVLWQTKFLIFLAGEYLLSIGPQLLAAGPSLCENPSRLGPNPGALKTNTRHTLIFRVTMHRVTIQV